jgi:MFS family permease
MSESRTRGGSRKANRALDAVNFFLADVRGGLGPFLAVYLLTIQNWDEAGIGIVMSMAGAAGILAQVPAGALIDATRAKRTMMIVAAILVTGISLTLPWLPTFWPVALSQASAHAAGAVLAPALAAVTLGIVGHQAFTKRIARNEGFNHAGNVFAAGAAGIAAYVWGPSAIFIVLAAMSVASLISVVAIPGREVDHDVARGLHDATVPNTRPSNDQPSGLSVLLTCRPLLVFAACATLFHLANAAMLPLVGQKLALQDAHLGTSLMSACIVAAQIVMVPIALLVGAKADVWGRKPLFLIGLLILPIRGMLYTFSDDPAWLVGVQLLDGVGAGIYGAIFPIIVADLMRGTGRFNIAQGAVTTAHGAGAAASTTLAGLVVVHAGYSAAFLTLGAIAAVGLLLFLFAMPETREWAARHDATNAAAARIAPPAGAEPCPSPGFGS